MGFKLIECNTKILLIFVMSTILGMAVGAEIAMTAAKNVEANGFDENAKKTMIDELRKNGATIIKRENGTDAMVVKVEK